MKRIHYGWVICLCATLILGCGMGLTVNAFSVYLNYFIEQWGYTHSLTSLFNTMRSLFAFLSMFFMGPLFKRAGIRNGLTFGMLLTALGFALGSLARNRAVFFLCAMCLGTGYGLCGVAGTSMLVRRWFHDRLGFALGMCACGSGLAAMVGPEVITMAIERHGLRPSFLGEAAVVAAIGLLTWLLMRNDPAEKGQTPYGEGRVLEGKKSRLVCCDTPLSRRDWVLLIPSLICLGMAASPATGNFAVHFRTCGFSPVMAAAAVSVFGAVLTGSKFLFGAASDRWGCRRATTVFCLILMSGFAVMCLLKRLPQPVLLILSAVLVGIGYPPSTVGLSIWAGDLEMPEHYDVTVRRFQSLYLLGTVVGSPLPGLLADRFGSYVPAYALMILFIAVILTAVLITYRRRSPKAVLYNS